MRPYILQGHSRPLNQVKFNTEGDLLVTCGKDNVVNLWWSDNGARAGTFNGHNGSVWTVDVSYDSATLLTASGDSTARLWDLATGRERFKFSFHEPARAARFNAGETMAAVSTDPFMASVSAVRLFRLAADAGEQSGEAVRSMTGPRGRISRVEWTDCNASLLTASEDGVVRRWDVETGKVVQEAALHEKHIADLQMSADGSHFVTASADRSAKVVDARSLEVLRTFTSTVPVNAAAISPLFDHVLIGGGQEASQVTTTAGKAGRFEARFFHKVYGDEFANVRGHYGPINAIAFSPDGLAFVSGGEEGYVRLHHLDASYFLESEK